jgi:Cu/Ag efflux pump CusA
MRRWVIGSSLKFRFIVVAASVALMVFGVWVIRDSPVDVFPEFAQPVSTSRRRRGGSPPTRRRGS